MSSDVDYAALFEAMESTALLLDPHLLIVDANPEYLRTAGRTRKDIVGKYIFDVYPDNPDDPHASGVRNLTSSLQRVLVSGEPEIMALQRYDIPAAGRPGVFEERWWSITNTPVLASDGTVKWIINHAEDVSAFVDACRARPGTSGQPSPVDGRRIQVMETELYARSVKLQRRNEELRDANERERAVAVTLQEAMLQTPDLAAHSDIAVRYLPAVGSLNVCGDWYDVVDLPPRAPVAPPPHSTALAVGDVIGHGLKAAAVMGMLRSALSAIIRATPHPGQALEALGLYARSFEDALGTTVVDVLLDKESHLIIYSNAGHPPPLLARTRRGECELLDQATDPPLGARMLHVPRPQATLQYEPGDTLVLYTDGLIERRAEDIDTGLDHLASTLAECSDLDVECLADTLLSRLGVSKGGRDDIALVVARL
jgi:PAS domain S-box-containing protein